MPERVLAEEESAGGVHGERPVPDGPVEPVDRTVLPDQTHAGVVVQDVDAAQGLSRRADRRRHLLLVRHVGGVAESLGSDVVQPCDEPLQRLCGEGRDREARALGGEAAGDRLSHPADSPGHERPPAEQALRRENLAHERR